MGIHINLAVLINQWVKRHALKGPVATLGVQHLSFSGADLDQALGASGTWAAIGPDPIGAADFFGGLGLRPTIAIDASDHEGADVIFDLNSDAAPKKLKQAFGLVLNGGTLEHVFHVPNALANITEVLSVEGVVIHVLPLNNWVDHGFFQFSPTLMFDYYDAAGFDPLESVVVAFEPRRQQGALWEVSAAPRGLLGQGGPGSLDDRTYLYLFVARRSHRAVESPVPMQSLYRRTSARGPQVPWFSTYELNSGARIEHPSRHIAPLRGFVKEGDFAWRVAVPEMAPWADSPQDTARSRLVILEDDLPLGPAHTLHETIRDIGGGAYSHWGEQVLLSTPDGSDPNVNGKTYLAVLPASIH